MNRYILLVVTSTILNTSLFSGELSMLEFRHQQKTLTLNAFKTLFKKRNMASHKRELKLKYKRTKELHNSNIISNMRVLNTKDDSEVDTTNILKVTTPVLQIKSNNELIKPDAQRVDSFQDTDSMIENIEIPNIQDTEPVVENILDSKDVENIQDTEPVVENILDSKDVENIQDIEPVIDDILDSSKMQDTQVQSEIPIESTIIQENLQEDVELELVKEDEIVDNIENTKTEPDEKFSKIRSLGANPWGRK
ncbi:MAG: hypothetical protein U9P72_03440 [Campylobacterota bacterium]|nr:hypothetical protein [Campylobacterota bacterium]